MFMYTRPNSISIRNILQTYFISFTDYVEIQLRKGAMENRIRANAAETGETAGEDRNGRVGEMEQEVQCRGEITGTQEQNNRRGALPCLALPWSLSFAKSRRGVS